MGEARRRKRARGSDAVVGIAWYVREQWDELRRRAAGLDNIEESYDEWLAVAERQMGVMAADGHLVVKVPMDIEEVTAWCAAAGRPFDSAARADFAVEKLKAGTGAPKPPHGMP